MVLSFMFSLKVKHIDYNSFVYCRRDPHCKITLVFYNHLYYKMKLISTSKQCFFYTLEQRFELLNMILIVIIHFHFMFRKWYGGEEMGMI